MFGKNKKKNNIKNVKAEVMPVEFYGGNDPVVRFKKVEKEIKDYGLTKSEKKHFNKEYVAGGNKPMHPANIFSNRKLLIIGSLVLFVVFLLLAGTYYWWQYNKEQNIVNPPAPVVAPAVEKTQDIVVTPPKQDIMVVPEIVINDEELAKVVKALNKSNLYDLEYPSILLGDAFDLDKDGLTDLEEEVFMTDPGILDTDEDGYLDSLEVYHLYNPAGFKPTKVVDSGLVKEYVSQLYNFSIYYPQKWMFGDVKNDGTIVLFSANNGESIELRVFKLKTGESFLNWFAEWGKNEKYQDLVDFESVFKEVGKKRSDDLVYYFSDGRMVYALLYHPNETNVIGYRSLLEMMARSFRKLDNFSAIPIQLNDKELFLNTTSSVEIFENTTSTEEIIDSVDVTTSSESVLEEIDINEDLFL